MDDCKDLQKRVSRVLSEVRRASKSLDEQHVRVVVRAAEELDLLAHGRYFYPFLPVPNHCFPFLTC